MTPEKQIALLKEGGHSPEDIATVLGLPLSWVLTSLGLKTKSSDSDFSEPTLCSKCRARLTWAEECLECSRQLEDAG